MKLAFFCTGSGAFLKFIYKNLEILVESKKGARVNVIGYSKKGVRSEDNLLLSAADIDKNYSLDSKGKIFRVEVYEGKNFCGMLNLKAK